MPDPYWLLYFSTSGEVQGSGTGPAGFAGAAGLAGATGGAAAAGFSAVGFVSPSGGVGAGDLTSSAMPGSVVTRAEKLFGNPTLLTASSVIVNGRHHNARWTGEAPVFPRTTANTSAARPESFLPGRGCAGRRLCDGRDW